MSAGDEPRAREIAAEALELPTERRAEFLDRACGDDATLRARVDAALLQTDATYAGPPDAGSEGEPADRSLAVPGAFIGGYRLIRRIGEGGMGSVWEAEQRDPRRVVALKTLRRACLNDDAARRFRYESEILARLAHPAIAQVYETGTSDEGPWFAMELVPDARTLIEHCTAGSLSVAARLGLFLQVCDAIQHGHQRGVVHRDLKPANILVGADGHPKVIDFGIARLTEDDADRALRTRTGELVGTLQYMSPEQVGDAHGDVDTRTDVYALGLVLFELLTGRPAQDVRGLALTRVVSVIRDQPLPRVREHAPDLPRDLEWVVQTACAKEARARYAGVSELAADLGRFLRGEPVLAGSPSRLYLARKFVRRHRFGVTMSAVVAALLVAGLLSTWTGLQRERRERERTAAVKSFLESMFTSVSLRNLGPEARIRQLLDQTADRVDAAFPDEPRIRADLHKVLAIGFFSVGNVPKAHEEARLAHAVLSRELAPDDEDRRALEELLSKTTSYLAPSDATSDAFMASFVARQRERHGFGSRPFLAAAVDRARYLGRTARYAAAEAWITGLIAELDARGEPIDPQASYLYDVLQSVLVAQGRLDEAVAVTERQIARREGLGPDHPDLIMSRFQLAQLEVEQGRPEDAEPLLRDTYERSCRVYGVGHPFTVGGLWLLYDVLHDRDPRAALELLQTAAAEIEASEASDPHQLATIRATRAALLATLGRTDEAVAAYRDVMPDLLEGAARDAKFTVRQLMNLVELLMRRGEPDAADEPMARAVQLARDLLPPTHPDREAALEQAAALHEARGDADGARALRDELESLREKRAKGNAGPRGEGDGGEVGTEASDRTPADR